MQFGDIDHAAARHFHRPLSVGKIFVVGGADPLSAGFHEMDRIVVTPDFDPTFIQDSYRDSRYDSPRLTPISFREMLPLIVSR